MPSEGDRNRFRSNFCLARCAAPGGVWARGSTLPAAIESIRVHIPRPGPAPEGGFYSPHFRRPAAIEAIRARLPSRRSNAIGEAYQLRIHADTEARLPARVQRGQKTTRFRRAPI